VGTSVKERLTGAAILVALIVLLVPELLRGPVRPVGPATAASSEEPPLRSYTIKLGEDAHARGAASPAASGPQPPAPIPASAEPASPPAEPAVQAAEPAPAPSAKATISSPAPAEHPASALPAPGETPAGDAGAPGGAFVIQLGSFASRDNAERLAKQVRGQGFSVSVSRSPAGRHLYRVLVGPAHDHAAAVQLEAKLHTFGHSGSIVAK
jgi:DedD protein